MSTPMTTPPGWYPDPATPGALRYWDGATWAPAAAPVAPRPAPGVDPNTVWIWLIVVLPVLPTLLLLFVPWGSLFPADAFTTSPFVVLAAELHVFSSPAYWCAALLSYAVYGLNAWFAARDRRELLARGVDAPFPWPWMFLSIVYPIGRSAVVLRRTGRGAGPLWALGAVTLVSLAVAGFILWTMAVGVIGGMQDLARYTGASA